MQYQSRLDSYSNQCNPVFSAIPTCRICTRVLSHDKQFSQLITSVLHCSTKQPSKQVPIHLKGKIYFNQLKVILR
jgi:hypothetical protein